MLSKNLSSFYKEGPKDIKKKDGVCTQGEKKKRRGENGVTPHKIQP